jgi:hypothetical protein
MSNALMTLVVSVMFAATLPIAVFAQQPTVVWPLLDHLAGKWGLRGMVAGQQGTHDVEADWVLNHHDLPVHEVSRSKNEKGQQQYEAMIFIAWNDQVSKNGMLARGYMAGFFPARLGVAAPKENEVPFIFKSEKGNNTFYQGLPL